MPSLVLIAEADQVLRDRMVDAIAAACDAEVVGAPDGADALERWARRAPDVLVLASGGPVIDGVTAARRARSGVGRPPMRVVFTDSVPDEVRRPGDAVLARPLDLSAFAATVRDVLAASPGIA